QSSEAISGKNNGDPGRDISSMRRGPACPNGLVDVPAIVHGKVPKRFLEKTTAIPDETYRRCDVDRLARTD
ncbi:hypothetical protein R3X46_25080, partial [Salmonella enterica subsp. enterica serovar Agona]|uniref:hypothetical protein n=1 Tax=Salmonella enterica TaxID=28901 RepID=UPI002A75B65B